MEITELRLFASNGKLLSRTKTPAITNLREYRAWLGCKVAQFGHRRYDGHHGMFFRLYDGTTRIVILGQEVGALAATIAPTGGQHIAAR